MLLADRFSKTQGYFRRHPVLGSIAVFFFIIFILLLLHYHLKHLNARREHLKPPIAVVVASTYKGDVPIFIPALGSVIPTDTVTVRTQINGRLQKVLYREGQDVKAGQLLASIDERPYLAQLVQFQGQLIRDQAALVNAQLDLQRYQKLYPSGAVSKQVYDTQKALVAQNQGNVKFDEGQIQTVKVNLIYCRIVSPIDGRVGLRLVDEGNFVQTSDTNGLVVVNTINPITVIFSIPEDNVPQVLQEMAKGQVLQVNAYDRDQNQLLAVGKLLTIDNQIDTTTGTVKLKAQFQNNDYRLFPNQFVNIQLLVNILHNVTIVPSAAVQHGAQGAFVFVLNNNNTVTLQPVSLGVVAESKTVINQGVLPNQIVVVEGSDKLVNGSRVVITPNSATTSTPPEQKISQNSKPTGAK